MATSREYYDGVIESVAKLQQMKPTDKELAGWVDDLQSAESNLHMMASHIEDLRGCDQELDEPEVP